MKKIIIVTHGKLSEEFYNTSKLIVGVQPDVETYSVELGCNIELLKKDITTSLNESKLINQEVIILTDIFFGTPFNIVINLIETFNFIHITGINLGILLEVLVKRDEITHENIMEIIELGRNGIVESKNFLEKLDEIEKGGVL